MRDVRERRDWQNRLLLVSLIMPVSIHYWAGEILNLRYSSTIVSGSSHVVALNTE